MTFPSGKVYSAAPAAAPLLPADSPPVGACSLTRPSTSKASCARQNRRNLTRLSEQAPASPPPPPPVQMWWLSSPTQPPPPPPLLQPPVPEETSLSLNLVEILGGVALGLALLAVLRRVLCGGGGKKQAQAAPPSDAAEWKAPNSFTDSDRRHAKTSGFSM
mmetsp:Transcript_1042/g.3629  ORF Transcript_1042/g.3629 Transcript_1042/m.3629 type:complete len:161 (+) Transcript_1042:583-1065(+)